MKYLVVDDAKLARKMMIKALKEFIDDQDTIIEACDGKEALEAYKKDNFDLIFMDLTMPIMDGFEATEAILQYNPQAKVIIVSADIQEQAIQKVLEIGAMKFIKKPVDKAQLVEFFQ
ncbi:MAG: response regulator [Campylobacterales bacterium]|nr:response regulator [Campylobacterales bacterium]